MNFARLAILLLISPSAHDHPFPPGDPASPILQKGSFTLTPYQSIGMLPAVALTTVFVLHTFVSQGVFCPSWLIYIVRQKWPLFRER